MTVPEVRALIVYLLDVREWDVDEILWWSHWRREWNYQATGAHRKRRLDELRWRGMRSRARESAL